MVQRKPNNLLKTKKLFMKLKTPTRFGYNELDRRRTDLCELLHQPCTISELWSTTIQIIKDVKPNVHF